jgi:SAM-dependent methyltransferase
MPDPTTRFSNRVDDYVKARPGYPPEIIATLRERICLSPAWMVADVGAGTGISAKLFVDNGNSVTAVEPNAAMRDASVKMLGHHARFGAIDGTAEHTTLADRSVRLVVAAQAFHWFDRPAFRRECMRILEPGGYVVLMWNDRQTTGSIFLDRYERLLEEFGTDYKSVNHRNIGDAGVSAFFAPCHCDCQAFPSAQRFDYDGLKSRLLSSSYAPAVNDPRSGPMLDALRKLFDATQQNGTIEMTYQTQLYWGKLS